MSSSLFYTVYMHNIIHMLFPRD